MEFSERTQLTQRSLYRHERRSTLVLDQEHQEFRRLGAACVPVNDMNIVRAFIEGLSWCQYYLLSTLQLHHNGALQYVNACALCRWIALDPPGACSTVIIRTSLPGFSVRSLDMSDVTLSSWATALPLMRHSRTSATSLIVIIASFVRCPRPARGSG